MDDADNPTIERVWRQLRPHVEWAEGFSLILLFAGHPLPVAALRGRLEESLRLRTLRLDALAPEAADQLPQLLPALLGHRDGPGRGPLWVELWRNSDEEAWRRGRRRLLRRLNERRFLLERDLRRPLILVLPEAERRRFYIDAPDLWTVRSFTAALPSPRRTPAPMARDEGIPVAGRPPGPAEQEWARLWGRRGDALRLDPSDGFRAFDAAMERGDLEAAAAIARQAHDLARQRRTALGDTPEALRDLSISLGKLGDVERALGNPDAACAAYNESLELCRQLRTALGDTPEALRDLSVSLSKLGDVERDLGNPDAARAAYNDSLDLCRQLRTALGDVPQALRDLSVALERLGDVERDLGNPDAARAAYDESLDLCRQLRTALGDTPQALRDLSVALEKLGDVERDLGNPDAARAAYTESLDLCRQLMTAFPDHPGFRRDLDYVEARLRALGEAAAPAPAAADAPPA